VKKWKIHIADIIFKDEMLQGEEEVLTEEEIEGYSFCTQNKEKCFTDCSIQGMPTISGIS